MNVSTINHIKPPRIDHKFSMIYFYIIVIHVISSVFCWCIGDTHKKEIEKMYALIRYINENLCHSG